MLRKSALLTVIPMLFLASCKEANKPSATPNPPDNKPAVSSADSAPAPAKVDASTGEKISFSSQVRPILSNNCFACHGPDSHNQTSPFRLDTEEHSRANLAKAGESPRYGVVPGKPEESLLLQRIATKDPHEVMPPPYAKKPMLTEHNAVSAPMRRLTPTKSATCGDWRASAYHLNVRSLVG